ncbi:SPOR domain-containing protein [Sphingomonas sp. GC_Shp_3]|uniref:SPOR domain-containing protein n=1 Tax=Sphingomonas sp. GC_Shp_3 TaxID=2937383 RepID=UPI00226A95B5|nr:SPOR domain-containing protein [Sphingomonas sp. GC_Shp_3]
MKHGLLMIAATLSGVGGGMILSAPAFADVKAGVDAWSRGDYRKAIDEWRPLAIRGDADAQFNLAQAYKLGRGVPVDMPMAESWYRKAALQGHQQAQDNYGLILFDENKRADAVQWLEGSAKRGEPRAQLVLGTMLFNGDNVPKDWPRAYALILRSAAQGQARAPQVQAQMDQYLSAEDRQRGMTLSRQYEADAQRPQLPPEIANVGAQTAMRGADLPPSSYDPNAGRSPVVATPRPERDARPGAGYSRPSPGYATPPVRDTRPALGPSIDPADEPDAPPRDQAAPLQDRHVPPATRDRATPPPRRTAPVRAAAPSLASTGRWRIQLGAFRDDDNARTMWRSLQGRLTGLQPFYVKSGGVTRLQAGPLASGAAASRACAAARSSCVPVAP